MFIPFGRKRSRLDRIMGAFHSAASSMKKGAKKLSGARYAFQGVPQKLVRMRRSARYAADDAKREAKKISSHTESLLFSLIIVLAIIMVAGAGNANFINSLVALLLLVLIVIIYMQLKFQKGMLEQYVPKIALVRITMCRAYSERVRTVNLYGAKDRMDRIRSVRRLKIGYEVVNDSFSPVSIQSASLEVKLRRGGVISMPSAMSILNVEPKRASGTEVTFRLPREVDFDSIDWVELQMKGNCEKKVRTEPHLYVNIMIRGKNPELIFEPFEKFRKRPEIAGSSPKKHL